MARRQQWMSSLETSDDHRVFRARMPDEALCAGPVYAALSTVSPARQDHAHQTRGTEAQALHGGGMRPAEYGPGHVPYALQAMGTMGRCDRQPSAQGSDVLRRGVRPQALVQGVLQDAPSAMAAAWRSSGAWGVGKAGIGNERIRIMRLWHRCVCIRMQMPRGGEPLGIYQRPV